MADSVNRKWVVFDGWTDGEYGTMPAHDATEHSFTGSNVVRYENGLLGPRPGLHKHTITSNVNGQVWGLFYIGVPDDGALAVVIGDGVYLTDNDTDFTPTLIDTLTAEPDIPVCFTMYDPNTQVYLTVPGQNTLELNVTAQTLTEILDKGGLACFLWKDRLYVTGVRNTDGPWLVYFSDAASFTSFGLNFFSLGYHWDGYAFAAMGNNLFIGTRSEGWWALTGGSADSGTLRLMYAGSAPHKQQQVVTENGLTWYWMNGYDGASGIDLEAGVAKLATTNGSVFDADSHQHIELSGERFGIFSGRRRHIVFASDDDQGVARWYGAWSHLDFDVDLSGHICDTNVGDRVVLAGASTSGTQADYYSLMLALNRPGFLSDGRADPGDDSQSALDAHFATKLWLHPAGDEVRARRVVVEFQRWDTGSLDVADDPETNHMDIKVGTYGRNGVPGISYETIVWDDPASNAPATDAGTEDRIVKNFGEYGWGGGFIVKIENMRGVAIRRVFVEYDDNAERVDAA